MPSLFGMTPARSSTLLPFALLILMIPPFLADMALPLGMSVWVLYLLPLTLSYMTSRAIIPPLLAVTATLLMAIGYQIAPAGVDPTVAQVNRSLGGLTAPSGERSGCSARRSALAGPWRANAIFRRWAKTCSAIS